MQSLSPEIYAAILAAAPDVVLVVDDEGRMVFVSAAASTVFGRSPDALVGRPIEELMPAAHRSRHRDQRAAYQQRPTVRHMGTRVDIVGLHADGREIPLEVSLSPVRVGDRNFVICIARDATERRQLIAQLRELGNRDALTGLYSRHVFETESARLDAAEHMPVACFVLDLDSLKVVNDTRGHAAGDELIRRAANLLRGVFRGEDMLARIGGDELAVLIPGMDEAAAAVLESRIYSALEQQIVPPDASRVALSLGWSIATAPPLAHAISTADAQMYAAKRAKPERSGSIPIITDRRQH